MYPVRYVCLSDHSFINAIALKVHAMPKLYIIVYKAFSCELKMHHSIGNLHLLQYTSLHKPTLRT